MTPAEGEPRCLDPDYDNDVGVLGASAVRTPGETKTAAKGNGGTVERERARG